MRRRTKWAAAGAAVAALGPWLPGWLAAAGLDAWNVPAVRSQMATNLRIQARLDGEIADLQGQIRSKDRLVDELIAGRLSLADATDQFEAMLALQPRTAHGLRQMYPDVACDRERVARHVMDYTRSRLADSVERDRLAARMAAEMTLLFPRTRPADMESTG